MPFDLPIGRALRRFRVLNAIKQGHVAELLKVSQGTVLRWESGEIQPDADHRFRIGNLIRTNACSDADAALKRLILTSSQAVHLVCDATHELLVASPARAASWQHNETVIDRSGVAASDQSPAPCLQCSMPAPATSSS